MKSRSLPVAVLSAALALGTVAALPVAAQDAAPVLNAQTDDLGTYLVDGNGMTLYYFTKDVFSGHSVCAGPCAEAWPPRVLGIAIVLSALYMSWAVPASLAHRWRTVDEPPKRTTKTRR